jgi:hypothetical protein
MVEPDITGLNISFRVKGSIYPNPSNGMLTLKTNNLSINQVRTFSLLNYAGQEVFRKSISQGTETINLPDILTSGVYLARVVDSMGRPLMTEQIVLSK